MCIRDRSKRGPRPAPVGVNSGGILEGFCLGRAAAVNLADVRDVDGPAAVWPLGLEQPVLGTGDGVRRGGIRGILLQHIEHLAGGENIAQVFAEDVAPAAITALPFEDVFGQGSGFVRFAKTACIELSLIHI